MTKEKSIKLSKKHGVNATIPVCFWCGENKNEIVLLGKLPGDKEAPKNMLLDYEPCDKCAKEMAQGMCVIEVSTQQPHQGWPAISKDEDGNDAYPTGRWAMVKKGVIEINGKALDMPRVCFDEELYAKMLKDAGGQDEAA